MNCILNLVNPEMTFQFLHCVKQTQYLEMNFQFGSFDI